MCYKNTEENSEYVVCSQQRIRYEWKHASLVICIHSLLIQPLFCYVRDSMNHLFFKNPIRFFFHSNHWVLPIFPKFILFVAFFVRKKIPKEYQNLNYRGDCRFESCLMEAQDYLNGYNYCNIEIKFLLFNLDQTGKYQFFFFFLFFLIIENVFM